MHGEILKAQLKTVQEDMHRATMELRDRQLKVSRLVNKFDVMVGKRQGGGVDKEEGEERSQAYFVIKAAQDREQLQREGDGLDAQIRQAEKEVGHISESRSVMSMEESILECINCPSGMTPNSMNRAFHYRCVPWRLPWSS